MQFRNKPKNSSKEVELLSLPQQDHAEEKDEFKKEENIENEENTEEEKAAKRKKRKLTSEMKDDENDEKERKVQKVELDDVADSKPKPKISHSRIKPVTPNETIDLICQLAKAKNKEGLLELINSGISINTYYGLDCATKRLASENNVDIDALNLLIGNSGLISDAIEGAAMRGNTELIETLLKKYRSSMQNDIFTNRMLLYSAVFGAARAGNKELTEQYVRRVIRIEEEMLYIHGFCLDRAVEGAAEYKEVISKKVKPKDFEHKKMERKEEIEQKDNEHKEINERREWIDELIRRGARRVYALKGAARAKNKVLMEELAPPNNSDSAIFAVEGAAEVGDLAMVKSCLINNPHSLNAAVCAAAGAGHATVVEYLVDQKDIKLNGIATSAMHGGHLVLVENLMHNHTDDAISLAISAWQALTDPRMMNETVLLRLLLAMPQDNQNDFVEFVARMSPKNLDVVSLLKKTNKLDAVWKEVPISYEQAFAWEKPAVQGLWFLCNLNMHLPKDLYYIVAAYLFPSQASDKEAKELFEKVPSFEQNKVGLCMRIGDYYNHSGFCFTLFGSERALFKDKRALDLISTLQTAEGEDGLENILSKQLKSLAKDDPLSSIIGKKRS